MDELNTQTSDNQQKQTFQKRQTAFKVTIKDVLNGEYIQQEGLQPNYITVNNNKVSRVNIFGTIVFQNDKTADGMLIDDGTGKISLRVFDETHFNQYQIGDFVLLIGRPRVYNNEKYIVPEIIKKIDDPTWIKIRHAELAHLLMNITKNENVENPKSEKVENVEPSVEVEDLSEENNDNKGEDIFKIIKNLDNGEGADVEKVIQQLEDKDGEKLITTLLTRGEVFETKPGRIKVLE